MIMQVKLAMFAVLLKKTANCRNFSANALHLVQLKLNLVPAKVEVMTNGPEVYTDAFYINP